MAIEKISILGLTGKEKEKAVLKITDDNKKELIELELNYQGKPYRAVLIVDFNLLRRAMGALIKTDFVKGTGKDAAVNVSVDDLGAGDKILFNGWYEGDEDIRKRMALRAKACKQLGQWVQNYMDENDIDSGEEEEEKKS